MSKSTAQYTLPGEELVEQGLADIAERKLTDCALLLLIAAPRLSSLGIQVPKMSLPQPVEHLLYQQLEERLGTDAHSHYNSLLRRIGSYAHALEREQSATLKK
jgi:hypothetical protein